MFEFIKLLAAGAATVIAIVAYLPYLIDMFRGKNRPHLYTWISIFLVTFTVGIIQLIGGAGWGAVPTIIGAFINGIVLFYCFRFGTKDIVFLDKVCLVISVAGVGIFVVLHSRPLLALAVVTAAEVTSFLPTFRKTHSDPYSESLPSYYLIMLKCVLILVALKEYNWLTASYSILWLGIFVVFLALVYRWRTHAKRHPEAASDIAHI